MKTLSNIGESNALEYPKKNFFWLAGYYGKRNWNILSIFWRRSYTRIRRMKKSSADLSIIGSTDVINASMSFPKFQRPQIKILYQLQQFLKLMTTSSLLTFRKWLLIRTQSSRTWLESTCCHIRVALFWPPMSHSMVFKPRQKMRDRKQSAH